MIRILILFLFYLLFSCTSQNNYTEFIQLNHENIMVIKGDRLTITLLPTENKRKKSVIVKTLKNNEQYENRRITFAEYQKIREIIIETNQKDIELPQSPNKMVAIIDGGSNSIILIKDSIEKKLYTRGISKQYHGKFYEATELILKAAKLSKDNIN